jgi:amidase
VTDLLFRPAGEIAALIRSGEIAARELTEASLRRVEALQATLNAFVHVDHDGALAAAAAVGRDDPRPFAGVPIAVKDGAAVAGMPLAMGSELFGGYRPTQDSFVVRRLKAAGFVIVGKTNMPEFGILPVSEPRRFGAVRNPWDLGLVGLKPSRGRISRGPEGGDDFLVQDGVLTRTVAETAELLDLLAGYEPGDAAWAPPPEEPFAAAAARDPGRLLIGVTTDPAIPAQLDPDCKKAVHDAASLLSELGHSVEELEAPWKDQDLLETFTLVFVAPVGTGIHFGGVVSGREPSEELVEPLSWAIWKHLGQRNPVEYLLARSRLTTFARSVVALWQRYDAVLLPALAQRPVRIGEIDACSAEPWEDFRRSGQFTPYSALFNVTGQPAVSLPLFHGADGLPLGVQLAGRPAGEGALLSLAAQLEAARPWAERRPELAAASG